VTFWLSNKLRRAAATICPAHGPRPAMVACSGSIEPGWPSPINQYAPSGRPHTLPVDRMYATDIRQTSDVRRQTASLLNAPWAGHNKELFPHLFDLAMHYLSVPYLVNSEHSVSLYMAVYAPQRQSFSAMNLALQFMPWTRLFISSTRLSVQFLSYDRIFLSFFLAFWYAKIWPCDCVRNRFAALHF